MTVQLRCADFAPAVVWAAQCCAGLRADPVLGAVLLEFDADQLRLTATNVELTGTAATPATHTGEPFRVLVSGRLLTAIVKAIAPDEDLTMKVDGNELSLTAPRGGWRLPLLSVEDFPRCPTSGQPAAEVLPADLLRAVTSVLPAVDRKRIHPTFGGVALSCSADVLTVATTDRYRIAVAETPCRSSANTSALDVAVPAAVLELACRAVQASGSARAQLCSSPSTFAVAAGAYRVTSARLANFVPWRAVDAAAGARRATVAVFEVAELSAALARATAVLDDRSAHLYAAVTAESVQLIGTGLDGASTASAPVLRHAGPPVNFGVNHRFLAAALACLDAPSVALSFGESSNQPFLIQPADQAGAVLPGYRHAIVPVRLDIAERAA